MIMTKPIKTALLSFGMSGRVFHGPFLHVHPGFELATVWQRSRSDVLDHFPYVEIVRTMEEILEDPEIELVFVNTPEYTHYKYTKAVLEAGKHAVVEKAFTVTSQEADELIALAQKNNLQLSVYQNRRWDGDFRTVRKVVEGKWLGRLTEFKSSYQRYRNYIQEGTWKEDPHPGAGIVYNLGAHLIDQTLVLFGMPLKVFADIRTQRTGGRVPDHFEITLFYKEMKATLMAGYLVREQGPRFKIMGTEGSFVKYGIDPQEEMLKEGIHPDQDGWGEESEEEWGLLNTNHSGIHIKGLVESIPGDYMAFYQNMYEAIREFKTLAVPPEDSANGIRIIEAAYQSHEEGKVIALKKS